MKYYILFSVIGCVLSNELLMYPKSHYHYDKVAKILGYDTKVPSVSEWESMSSEDFKSYKAVIINGDTPNLYTSRNVWSDSVKHGNLVVHTIDVPSNCTGHCDETDVSVFLSVMLKYITSGKSTGLMSINGVYLNLIGDFFETVPESYSEMYVSSTPNSMNSLSNSTLDSMCVGNFSCMNRGIYQYPETFNEIIYTIPTSGNIHRSTLLIRDAIDKLDEWKYKGTKKFDGLMFRHFKARVLVTEYSDSVCKEVQLIVNSKINGYLIDKTRMHCSDEGGKMYLNVYSKLNIITSSANKIEMSMLLIMVILKWVL